MRRMMQTKVHSSLYQHLWMRQLIHIDASPADPSSSEVSPIHPAASAASGPQVTSVPATSRAPGQFGLVAPTSKPSTSFASGSVASGSGPSSLYSASMSSSAPSERTAPAPQQSGCAQLTSPPANDV
jgi:hypothetical protein